MSRKAKKNREVYAGAISIGSTDLLEAMGNDIGSLFFVEREAAQAVLETLREFEFPQGEPQHSLELFAILES